MITNATITIYNREYDPLTRFDTWHRTVIRNVHVYVDHKASVSDSGLNSAEIYKIRIPAEVENADQYLGEYDLEIERPADLKDVRLRHCKVLSWSDNRFGGLPHWKIGGV